MNTKRVLLTGRICAVFLCAAPLCATFCCALLGCKTPAKIAAPEPEPPKVEEPKAYHGIELICGNASASVAGRHILRVNLANEPTTRKKLIVEVHFDDEGVATVNALIRKNRGKELSIVIPERMILVGRMDREIEDGKVSVASYSQAVAEEIRKLLIKE